MPSPRRLLRALACCLPLCACQPGEPPPTPPPAARESYGTKRYAEDGISLQLPAGAVVRPAEVADSGVARSVRVEGPPVSISPAGQSWTWEGPAYAVELLTFANPERRGVETWVAEHVRSKGEMVAVAGRPAVLVRSFGGDSEFLTFYVGSGERVVGVRFTEWPEGNSPIAAAQRDVHALILSTLRLE